MGGRIVLHEVPDDHSGMLMPASAEIIGPVVDALLRQPGTEPGDGAPA